MDVLAKKLSIIERITQTEREDLLEQVAALLDQDTALPQEHRAIIDERLTAHQTNPEKGSSWSKVKEKIQKELGG